MNDKNKSEADYDLAYKIVEKMGLGFEFRSCRCGQLPCARLKPIVDALKDERAEVWKDVLKIAEECVAGGNFGWTLREKLRNAAIRRDFENRVKTE